MLCAYAGPFAHARYIYSDILRKPGQPPVRQRRVLDVDTILHAGGGEGDWWLIETDAADWPEGVAMAALSRRLAAALVRSDRAWGTIKEVAQQLRTGKRLWWDEVAAIAERHFGRPGVAREDWAPHWPPLAVAVRGGYLPGGDGSRRIWNMQGD